MGICVGKVEADVFPVDTPDAILEVDTPDAILEVARAKERNSHGTKEVCAAAAIDTRIALCMQVRRMARWIASRPTAWKPSTNKLRGGQRGRDRAVHAAGLDGRPIITQCGRREYVIALIYYYNAPEWLKAELWASTAAADSALASTVSVVTSAGRRDITSTEFGIALAAAVRGGHRALVSRMLHEITRPSQLGISAPQAATLGLLYGCPELVARGDRGRRLAPNLSALHTMLQAPSNNYLSYERNRLYEQLERMGADARSAKQRRAVRVVLRAALRRHPEMRFKYSLFAGMSGLRSLPSADGFDLVPDGISDLHLIGACAADRWRILAAAAAVPSRCAYSLFYAAVNRGSLRCALLCLHMFGISEYDHVCRDVCRGLPPIAACPYDSLAASLLAPDRALDRIHDTTLFLSACFGGRTNPFCCTPSARFRCVPPPRFRFDRGIACSRQRPA